MTAIELAKQVRSSGNISEEIAAKVKAVVSNDTSGEVFDANEGFRFEVIKEVCRILCPENRLFIRHLLEQEIEAHGGGGGVSNSIVLCAGMLFELRQPEDALLIWQAKETSFDTHCGLAVELLVGAGVDRTLGYWRSQTSKQAKEFYEVLLKAAYGGEFADLEEFRIEHKQWLMEMLS